MKVRNINVPSFQPISIELESNDELITLMSILKDVSDDNNNYSTQEMKLADQLWGYLSIFVK